MRIVFIASLICAASAASGADAASHGAPEAISVGPRPYALIDQMRESDLKEKLIACAGRPVKRTFFSIGHRGAPLQFPEHTEASYRAAARMGAGVVECDVTFTKDKALVCRHSQNDLHTTTDILASPLASTCVRPFAPAAGGADASAECRTSEITLEEFRTLKGKMDGADETARDAEAYLRGTPGWRTDLYAGGGGEVMTHAETIALFASLGVKFMPELKSPAVRMPFDGFSREDYAQKLIDEYKAAGVPPADVWPQSFDLEDVLYWIRAEPDFGAQAVYLVGRYPRGLDPDNRDAIAEDLAALKAKGVNYLAPPIWMLVALEDGAIVPSAYARAARAAGLDLIAWTLERSGPLADGGGWYYRTIADAVYGDGVVFELLDVLARDVGVVGVFSDWPATTSYYASCMGLDERR